MSSRAFVSSTLKAGILSSAAILFFAYCPTYAQTPEDLHLLPTSVVEVVDQTGCPIAIEPVTVEAPLDNRYFDIRVRLRSVSNKSIIGLVISINSSRSGIGMTSTTFNADGLLSISDVLDDQYRVDFGPSESNVMLSTGGTPPKRFLSIDYAKFEDGSSWGDDLAKKSVWIEDALKGARAAVSDLLYLYSDPGPEDVKKMKALLNNRLASISPSKSGENRGQSLAYVGGYRNIILTLNRPDYSKPDAFFKKLGELRMRLIESNLTKP
jgi:hypothetical protein